MRLKIGSLFVAMLAVLLFAAKPLQAQSYSVLSGPVTTVTTVECYASPADNFNLPCAVQGARAFASCRQNGGGILVCAIEGFGTYVDCNGGLIARVRSRAKLRRAKRVARLRSLSSGCY